MPKMIKVRKFGSCARSKSTEYMTCVFEVHFPQICSHLPSFTSLQVNLLVEERVNFSEQPRPKPLSCVAMFRCDYMTQPSKSFLINLICYIAFDIIPMLTKRKLTAFSLALTYSERKKCVHRSSLRPSVWKNTCVHCTLSQELHWFPPKYFTGDIRNSDSGGLEKWPVDFLLGDCPESQFLLVVLVGERLKMVMIAFVATKRSYQVTVLQNVVNVNHTLFISLT